jgi:hypothetical protein
VLQYIQCQAKSIGVFVLISLLHGDMDRAHHMSYQRKALQRTGVRVYPEAEYICVP